MKPEKIYYINGTHWDREWYKTFQGFRYMLIDVVDEVIDTLESDPDFKMYMLDGQTAVLDDYTEIAPEKKARLTKLIAQGRIAVGPWYTMPDEFLPSGESLIRNLLLGHAKAKEYGAPGAMKYGYICDIFGHIAQLPQLMNGVGIHGVLMQRGNNMDTTPPHFRWVAPDGSACIAYRTPEDMGYGAFYRYATEPYNMGWDRDLEHLFDRAVKEIDRECKDLNQPYLVLHDALDHQHITKAAPWLAKRLSEHYGCPVVFETLDSLADRLWNTDLPEKHGELAETAHMDIGTNILLTYITSSRYDIKKENDRVQNLWERWAEPLSAIHALEGRAIRPRYRDVAYLELMRNHAHDSICGCAVEEVHRDMHYRFRQTRTIGEEAVMDCLRQDAARVPAGEHGTEMLIRVYQPLPYAGQGTYRLALDFPEDFRPKYSEGEREYEWKNSFFLYDSDGREVPYTLHSIERGRIVASPTLYKADRYTVSIQAALEPMGYTEFRVVPAAKGLRTRYIQGRTTGARTAENEFLRLHIHRDGTLCLTDKRTGRVFDGLLSYEDGADIGDGWMHIRPSSDSIFYGPGTVRAIEKASDGPAETAFRITTQFDLPECCLWENGSLKRSGSLRSVTIRTLVRLGAGNDFLDVETELENTVLDHRLQACFPTDVRTDTYFAGQAFAMLDRPVGMDATTTHWKEPQYGDRNFNGTAMLRDAEGGLAFLSAEGLHEVNAMGDDRRTLAVTLFRGFHKTIGHDDYAQMDGELLGTLRFAYRLMPLTPKTTEGHVLRCRDAMQAGVTQYTMLVEENYMPDKTPGFLRLTGENVLLSILKRPEDLEENTVILRLFNASDSPSEAECIFRHPIDAAWRADLLEEKIEPLSATGNRLRLTLGGRKIETLRIRLNLPEKPEE